MSKKYLYLTADEEEAQVDDYYKEALNDVRKEIKRVERNLQRLGDVSSVDKERYKKMQELKTYLYELRDEEVNIVEEAIG